MSSAYEWGGFAHPRRRGPAPWARALREEGPERGREEGHHGGHGHHGRGLGGRGTPLGGWDPFGGRDPWRGGRRRRAAGRGDVRIAALALLAEQPLHGYQIIQEINERSGGAWRPSPGSVYPALQQLADEGLVRIEDADGRKVVHLTEAGEAYVQAHREELDAVWNLATRDGDAEVRTLFDLMRQVGFAAAQVARAGDSTQVGRAHEILDDARRGLYRLLAGDDDKPDAGK